MDNLLSFEKSYYLSQHKPCLIPWQPLDEMAFLSARLTKKPIFLSVGYSSCKTCFDIETKFYEDRTLVNEVIHHYVPVKVDGDDRPDIDDAFRPFGYGLPGPNSQGFCIALTANFVPTKFLNHWVQFEFPAKPVHLDAKECPCKTIREDQKQYYAYANGEMLSFLCNEFRKTGNSKLKKMARIKAEQLVDSFLEINGMYHKNVDSKKRFSASLRDFDACIQGLKDFNEISGKDLFLDIALHMQNLRNRSFPAFVPMEAERTIMLFT